MGLALRTSAPREAMLITTAVNRTLAFEAVWFASLLDRTEIYHCGAPAASELISEPVLLLAWVIEAGDTVGIDLHGASYGNVELVLYCQPDLQLRDATAILHAAERVKTDVEVAAVRRANTIAVEVLGQGPALLHDGLTEAELAASLDGAARLAGSDGFAYPTLIGFGTKPLAAHASPMECTLQRDEMVTIAFGPMAAGYCADIVHTF